MNNIKKVIGDISNYMQYAYLFLFTAILIKYYLLTTMLENSYTYSAYKVIKWILFVYVILNIIITIINKGYESWFDIILSVLLLLCAFVVSRNIGEDEVFDIAMLIVGAKNVPWKKIAYCYLCVAVIIQVIAFYGVYTGMVPDIIGESQRGIRRSFGSIYPTDFAAHILFIELVYVSLREKELTFVEIIIMELVGYAVYQQTAARNDFICITVLCVLLCIVKLFRVFNIQLSKYKLINIGAVLMFLITVICIIGVTFYDPSNDVWNKFDTLLSGRISLSYQGLAEYGIQPFGTIVLEDQSVLGYTFFLDNSFLRIAIRYGWVFLSIITYIYFSCYIKMREYRKDYMIVVFIVLVIFGITEHHLIEIAYCPIWYVLFAKIKPDVLLERRKA